MSILRNLPIVSVCVRITAYSVNIDKVKQGYVLTFEA